MPQDLLPAIAAIATLATLGLLYVALTPERPGGRRLSRRLARIQGVSVAPTAAQQTPSLVRKPADRGGLLRFLPAPRRLQDRLSRAGLSATPAHYLLGSLLLLLLASGGFSIGLGFPPQLALPLGLLFALLLPHLLVARLAARRKARFIGQLPEAIDLIVRGLRSGLPISESLAGISSELPAPLGTDFKGVIDQVRVGATLEDALWSLARRLELPELKFFVIALSIQKETGGNLAETLSNLSGLLRQRRQMKLKVRALSSEAKASAYIIGSLPFAMFGVISLMNPGYTMSLFQDPRGMMMVAGGLLMFVVGALVMAKMVSFEI